MYCTIDSVHVSLAENHDNRKDIQLFSIMIPTLVSLNIFQLIIILLLRFAFFLHFYFSYTLFWIIMLCSRYLSNLTKIRIHLMIKVKYITTNYYNIFRVCLWVNIKLSTSDYMSVCSLSAYIVQNTRKVK